MANKLLLPMRMVVTASAYAGRAAAKRPSWREALRLFFLSLALGLGAARGPARRRLRLGRGLGHLVALERAHEREEDHVAEVLLPGEQRGEAVDPHAEAGDRRHAVLHGDEVVLLHDHGLLVTLGARLRLVLEAAALIDRVDELAVRVHDLPAV